MKDVVALIDSQAKETKMRGAHKPRAPKLHKLHRIDARLVGRVGEMLVATELMRRGTDVAYPESDYGVDIIAFRRSHDGDFPNKFVPIQVKARSASGYSFQKSWFTKAVNIALVQVWWISKTPKFYVFKNLKDVEDALDNYALSPSWTDKGSYNVTDATKEHDERMKRHLNKWERIIDQLPPERT